MKAWLVAVVFGVAAPVHAELTLELSHRAREVQPGEIVVLEVRPSEDPVTLSASAFGKTLRFFRSGSDAWVALLGIDLTTEPGSYDVLVHATVENGNIARKSYTLSVGQKDFPTRRLTVDPSFVSPPASVIERIQREARQLDEILKVGQRAVSATCIYVMNERHPIGRCEYHIVSAEFD